MKKECWNISFFIKTIGILWILWHLSFYQRILVSIASSRFYWACFERPINITYCIKIQSFLPVYSKSNGQFKKLNLSFLKKSRRKINTGISKKDGMLEVKSYIKFSMSTSFSGPTHLVRLENLSTLSPPTLPPSIGLPREVPVYLLLCWRW